MVEIKTFTVYFKTGDRVVVHGENLDRAITIAGLDLATVSKLISFYENGINNDWLWNRDKMKWYYNGVIKEV